MSVKTNYLLGGFTVTDRDKAIFEKAVQYIKATDGLDRRQGDFYSREFSTWCKERGFTHREMVDAKRQAERYLDT